jgi:hypothetical protein
MVLSLEESASADAQIKDPVTWTYAATKKSASLYEVTMTAHIEHAWWIYSQNTGKGGPVPTSFTFRPNPALAPDGTVKEVGHVVKTFDKNFNAPVLYYANEVTFVADFLARGATASGTVLNGAVEYMAANGTQALPPTDRSFSVKLP